MPRQLPPSLDRLPELDRDIEVHDAQELDGEDYRGSLDAAQKQHRFATISDEESDLAKYFPPQALEIV
jgi:hypothetical protein